MYMAETGIIHLKHSIASRSSCVPSTPEQHCTDSTCTKTFPDAYVTSHLHTNPEKVSCSAEPDVLGCLST